MKRQKNSIIVAIVLSMLLSIVTCNTMVFAKNTNENKKVGIAQPQITYVDDSKFTEDMYYHEEEVDAKLSIQKAVKSYDWDKFSAKYYYNKLSKEEKALWDTLDKMCKKLLTGTESLKINGVRCETKYVKANLKMDDMFKVGNMFVISNPQYYFLNCGGSYGYNSMALNLYTEYANGTKRAKATEELRVKTEQWLDDIRENSKPGFDRIRTAAYLICEKVQYDYPALSDDDRLAKDQSVISAVKDQCTVCAGYSKLFSMLGTALGYDVIGITSATHAWNNVKIDGKWYAVDTTWADGGIITMGNALFVKNSNPAIAGSDHVPLDYYKKFLPSCKKDYPTNHDLAVSDMKVTVKDGRVILSSSYDEAPPYRSKGYYTLDGTFPDGESIEYNPEEGIPVENLTPGTIIRFVFELEGAYSRVWSYKYKNITKPVITDIDNTAKGIMLKWSSKAKATGFKVYRKSGKADYELIADIKSSKTTSYEDVSAKLGTTYTYAVVAYNSKGGESEYSHAERMCRLTSVAVKAKKSTKTSMKVSWAKNAKAAGYQVSYSTSSKFASAKTVTVKGKVSTTVKGLVKGKKYYVRIRTYKTVSGVKYYSAWSKTVKCKL